MRVTRRILVDGDRRHCRCIDGPLLGGFRVKEWFSIAGALLDNIVDYLLVFRSSDSPWHSGWLARPLGCGAHRTGRSAFAFVHTDARS